MSDSKHGLSILYVAVFLLSLNGLFSKLIPLDAVSVTQLRSVIAAIVLFVFAYTRKRAYRLNGIREYAGVYLVGVILGLHWISFYYSMQVSTVAIGMLALFTYPVIMVFLEPMFNKKRVQVSDIIAALVVFAGVMIMVGDDINQFDSAAVQGVFWGVISAFLFSLRNLLQKYKHSTVSSDGLILHQVIAISIMLLMFVDVDATASLEINDWLLLILLGGISTATAHSLLSYSLKHLPAKSIAMISCLQPLSAAAFAWLIIGEIPTKGVVIGGLIIVSVAFYESVYHVGQRKK
ncbi:MAG: EamA family transporter [endosymbiont of Galathealinum brachiosum]|uniref:EamA family transporter n=1 Tax=endosymbiont of Galathealinum brachiosum TaxID=2200906 RepID=A0A370DHP3_9GAMM|nr:MAG: EamA family transporter [endosymbiont of Galathealinum brachiosum]